MLVHPLIFESHLVCQTKAYLIRHGCLPTNPSLPELQESITQHYREKTPQTCLTNITEKENYTSHGLSEFSDKRNRNFIDIDVDLPLSGPLLNASCDGSQTTTTNRPTLIRFVGPKLASKRDSLVLKYTKKYLDEQSIRTPENAKLVHGQNHSVKKIALSTSKPINDREIDEALETLFQDVEPKLLLNRHCSICEFHDRCRNLAIKAENLSLLTAVTPLEIEKYDERGITTITQLSYGYRPRRQTNQKRKSSGSDVPPKNDHRLRALALKKNQTHVVGKIDALRQGTHVYVDVEALPDQKFYYLIGVRYTVDGVIYKRSLWADTYLDEYGVWQEFLALLKTIENPRLVHYGAFDRKALQTLNTRYTAETDGNEYVRECLANSLNILNIIYGVVYFPTYSNSLKEVGPYLGFDFTESSQSGSGSILTRTYWDLTDCPDSKASLIRYNLEDCEAAEIVVNELVRLQTSAAAEETSTQGAVDVASLSVGYHGAYGTFDTEIPDLARVNKAAHWDYQRARVHVRDHPVAKRRQQRKRAQAVERATKVNKVCAAKETELTCPRCGKPRMRAALAKSHTVHDIKFMEYGAKRWTIRYEYFGYRCNKCQKEVTVFSPQGQYGPTICAYVLYLIIELRLAHTKAAKHVRDMFGINLTKGNVAQIKGQFATYYEPLYEEICAQINDGEVVHADETEGAVRTGGNYIWVFANPTTVMYHFSPSRERQVAEKILENFSGVLVTDFYPGYDGINCHQQKCLVHLIRDINNALQKNPFNDEIRVIAERFGVLMRSIIETVDKFGLRKRNMKKHIAGAETFLAWVTDASFKTRTAKTLQNRFDKNRNGLFRFLSHDGVPWNNNNAEHAVRAFTRVRNQISSSTPNGMREYCILLSLQQTLEYRGMEFFDFVRTGSLALPD